MTLAEILDSGASVAHKPCVRTRVTPDVWETATGALAEGTCSLLALWAEPHLVHMALVEADSRTAGIISLDAGDGTFPSVGLRHAPARRLERRIRELYGLDPVAGPDKRPWLDHGQFGAAVLPGGHPARQAAANEYEFLPAEGESLHQIPVGPVHAGIIEPGHFRFTANGETVVRLEQRLGYVHRGMDSLIASATIADAARIASRASGDTTVAYGIAFAQAVEAATGMTVPSRAAFLRALMLELERIANHLGDIGAVCNDASFSLLHAHCGILRERVLRTADIAFGHRLMMDFVVPGGVRADIASRGQGKIAALVKHIRRRFPKLMQVYEDTASLQDRTVGTGIAKRVLVDRFAAGGFIGRASGRAFDARKFAAVPPYDSLAFDVVVEEDGDVDARVRVRAREVTSSLSLIDQILARMPDGPVLALTPQTAGEGSALVEGFRGDIFAWLRVAADGTVERAFLRDPSWFQWPLLEAAIEGNIVADFPLCNKSFNCSYAGADL